MALFNHFNKVYEREREQRYTLKEYLSLCKKDSFTYATSAERMIKAIGEPEIIDTSKDNRLSRVFQNRTIKRYPAFEDFYGMEETIERLVGFFIHAAQGLEERKQILYLLGPVGGGKSSLAERLKTLMEKYPIYVLATEDEISPCLESPLGLFDSERFGDDLEKEYNIPKRYLTGLASPWAIKRLEEMDGDIEQFYVVKLMPSKLKQIGVVKTEPGDENNQDVSNLVGKVNLRKLDRYDQNDPDAYSYSGALCNGNQGLLEFVEMFKAPIKTLHPLLTATQEGNFVGTEEIGAMPFQGIVLAHSNESEWNLFKNNKSNEAFLDRIYVVKVPYCLRIAEEVKIYEKMLASSSLAGAACAPKTLDMLAQFSILSRLKEHENSNLYSKMRVYNGEDLQDIDTKAKTYAEYKDVAGVEEGMDGISTRFAFKILSNVFNYDTEEVSADPVHLMLIILQHIKREQYPAETEELYTSFVKEYLTKKYVTYIGNEIQKAYLESYSEYGQNIFDRYIAYADAWIDKKDYKDPNTGEMYDRSILNEELEKIEKPAGIANPKDFRNEVVKFNLKAMAESGGENLKWTAYNKLRDVIEKKMFTSTEELLPVISFSTKKNKNDEQKHSEFVDRMVARGYTVRQVRRLTDWYMRVNKSG